MRVSFHENAWNAQDFSYAYSPLFADRPTFVQEADGIVNERTADGKFTYVSLLTNRTFSTGSLLKTRCSFEAYGAPLLVFTDDVREGPQGELLFGLHYEVVAYEGGVNVWRLDPVDGSIRPYNLLRQAFAVPPGKLLTLAVQIMESELRISLDDTHFTLPVEGLPPSFRAGITACEGINRFTEFCVESDNGSI